MSSTELSPDGSPSRLVLRVALCQGGRILEERALPGGVLEVHVGPGTARLEVDPVESPALRESTAEAAARFTAGERFSVRADAIQLDRATERASGDVALTLGDRGRIALCTGHVVLFEVREAAPRRARPPLPFGTAPLLDARFTAIACASLMAHFAFVFVLENVDPPYVSASAISPRVAELLMEAPEPPVIAPPEVPLPSDAPSEATDETPSEGPTTVAEGRPTHHRGPIAPPSVPDTARLAEEIASRLGGGAIGTLMPGAGPTAGSILAGMGAGEPTGSPSGTSTLPHRGGGGTVSSEGLGTLHGVATAGPRSEGAELEASGPVGDVAVTCEELDCEMPSSGIFDVQRVIRAVARLRSALTRCYEHELTTASPDLHGSLDIAFDIEESGEVSHVRAVENTTGSADLAQCGVATFRRIPRFAPGPTGGSVSFRFPVVFTPND